MYNITLRPSVCLTADEHFVNIVVSGLYHIYPRITPDEAINLAQLHLKEIEMEEGVDYDDVARDRTPKEIRLEKDMHRAYIELERRLELHPMTQQQSDRLSDLVDDLLDEAFQEAQFSDKPEFYCIITGNSSMSELSYNLVIDKI